MTGALGEHTPSQSRGSTSLTKAFRARVSPLLAWHILPEHWLCVPWRRLGAEKSDQASWRRKQVGRAGQAAVLPVEVAGWEVALLAERNSGVLGRELDAQHHLCVDTTPQTLSVQTPHARHGGAGDIALWAPLPGRGRALSRVSE